MVSSRRLNRLNCRGVKKLEPTSVLQSLAAVSAPQRSQRSCNWDMNWSHDRQQNSVSHIAFQGYLKVCFGAKSASFSSFHIAIKQINIYIYMYNNIYIYISCL